MKDNVTTILLAKTRGKKGEHKIIFSSKDDLDKVDFFDVPDIAGDKTIEFDAEKKLESDEWFYVELDDEHKPMVKPYSKNISTSSDLNPITADDYSNVEVIYKISGSSENESEHFIVFQKVTKAYYIVSKRFITFGDHPEIHSQQNMIDFSGRQDAYFDGYSRLYFRSFSTIKSMFDGIEDYYRKATDDEVRKIKGSSLITISEDFTIGVRNLKRIAAILSDDKIKLDDSSFQSDLKAYIEKFEELEIVVGDDGKFELKSDRELGIFLTAALGRYYISEVTGEKMEATSASRLKNSGSDE